MEKVKVVKAIPGVLNIGDVLTSPSTGCDFILAETTVKGNSTNERFVRLDYITVSSSIPEHFVFDLSDYENEFKDQEACEKVKGDYNAARTDGEIGERYWFYQEQFDNAMPGSEQEIVFQNLMWFIDWLYGHKELED